MKGRMKELDGGRRGGDMMMECEKAGKGNGDRRVSLGERRHKGGVRGAEEKGQRAKEGQSWEGIRELRSQREKEESLQWR